MLAAGAAALRKVVQAQGMSAEAVRKAVEADSGALAKAFQLATGLACFTIFAAVRIERRSVKAEGKGDRR